jgi:hypothetical protein
LRASYDVTNNNANHRDTNNRTTHHCHTNWGPNYNADTVL